MTTRFLLIFFIVFITGCSKSPQLILFETKVTGDNVRVRANPNLEGEIIGKVNKNDRVTVHKSSKTTTEIDNKNYYWYKISFNKLSGWITAKYLLTWKSKFEFKAYYIKNKSYLTLHNFYKDLEVDLNGDGIEDYVFFLTQGDGDWVELLVSFKDFFINISLPFAAEYELIDTKNNPEIRLGFGTFPVFGSFNSPDKYMWYDFYIFKHARKELNNKDHKEFYKDMVSKYLSRIREIEEEIIILNEDSSVTKEINSMFISEKKAQINKYLIFIEKANQVIGNNKHSEFIGDWSLQANDGMGFTTLRLHANREFSLIKKIDNEPRSGTWIIDKKGRLVLTFTDSKSIFNVQNNHVKNEYEIIDEYILRFRVLQSDRGVHYINFLNHFFYK